MTRWLKNILMTALLLGLICSTVFTALVVWQVRELNPGWTWPELLPGLKSTLELFPLSLFLSLIASVIAVPVVRKADFRKIDSCERRQVPHYAKIAKPLKEQVRKKLQELANEARRQPEFSTGCTLRVNLLLPMPRAAPDSPPGHLRSVETVGVYQQGETDNVFAPGEGVSGRTYFTRVPHAEAGAVGVSRAKLDRMPPNLACVVAFPLRWRDDEKPAFGVVCIDILGDCDYPARDRLRLMKDSGNLSKFADELSELLDPRRVPSFWVEVNVIEIHSVWKFWKWWC